MLILIGLFQTAILVKEMMANDSASESYEVNISNSL